MKSFRQITGAVLFATFFLVTAAFACAEEHANSGFGADLFASAGHPALGGDETADPVAVAAGSNADDVAAIEPAAGESTEIPVSDIVDAESAPGGETETDGGAGQTAP